MNKFCRGSNPELLTMAFLSFTISCTTLTSCATDVQRVEESEKKYAKQVEEMKRKAEEKGKVVYAVREIKEGATIEAADLEEREIEYAKIPVDAITQSNLIAGRQAKFTIDKGSIVSQHAIAPRATKKKSKN